MLGGKGALCKADAAVWLGTVDFKRGLEHGVAMARVECHGIRNWQGRCGGRRLRAGEQLNVEHGTAVKVEWAIATARIRQIVAR